MEVKQEELEQLKKRYPSGVYEGSISFADDSDVYQEVAFLYRKPSTADVEAHSKSAQRSPIVANLNLLQSLIVYPASGVIDRIREYPIAVGKFVEEAVFPFFGANVVVKSKRL